MLTRPALIRLHNAPQQMGSPSIDTPRLKLFRVDDVDSEVTQKDSSHFPRQPKTDLKSVTVIVPVLNEADNLVELAQQITLALEPTGRFFELILVDDGSTDDSQHILQYLVENSHPTQPVQAILLAGNFGQTAALKAGIDAANSDYIVTLDGDLQNDPADIPAMIDQLDAGFEIVLGWRKQRQDRFWSRKIPSLIANQLFRSVTKTKVRDLGCALKAMTRELALQLDLVGDMHRFIAVLAHHLKAKSCQVPTNHRPRVHGVTKYGLGRIKRVLLDLFVLKALQHRNQPMHLFGGWAMKLAGGATAILGVASLAAVVKGPQWYLGLATGLGLLLGLGALQLFSIGLVAELSVRGQNSHCDPVNSKANYRIREVLSHATPDQADRHAA